MSDVLDPKALVNNPNIIAATLATNSSSMRTALGVMSASDTTTAIANSPKVTSVIVASTDLDVSGSPITSSGTVSINLKDSGVYPGTYSYPTITVNSKGIITNTGVATPPVTTFNTRSGSVTLQGSDVSSALTYVPARTGNNNDITSLYGVTGGISTADYVDFDTAASVTSTYGRVWIDDAEGGLAVGMKGGNAKLQVGQDSVQLVTNSTANPILAGQAVYLSGAVGNRATIALARANTEATSFGTIGLATEAIAVNGQGYVTTEGLVNGLNTSSFTEGQKLYLSASLAGDITNVKPVSTEYLINIGICVRSHSTNGSIYVRPSNETRLDALHNVSIATPTSGHLLTYNSTLNLWENSPPVSNSSIVYVPDIASGQDITSTLNSLLPTVAAGATVVFPSNKSYVISGNGVFASMQPGVSIEFNNTTLIPPAEFFHVANKAVFRVRVAGTSYDVTSSVTNTQVSYTLPAGVSAVAGDLLTFTSSDLVIGATGERYDWTCKVITASGQDVLLDTAAPATCAITKIRVTPMLGKSGRSDFTGLRVSLAACPDRNDLVPFQVWGVLIQNFDHPNVEGCEITGAHSACVGIQFDNCISPTFTRGSVSRFYCLPNFQGTGRLGYGVNFFNCSQGTVTESDLFACRHHVATGGFMPGNLLVEHNKITDDPAYIVQMTDAFGVQIDQHEGCIGQLLVNHNTQAIAFAGAYARGRQLRYTNNAARFIHSSAVGVALANERPLGAIVIADNEFSGAGVNNRIISTPSTDIESIDILRNRMDGGSVMIPGPDIPATVNLGAIRIKDNTLKAATRLFECQFASTTGKIGLLDISGNNVVLASTAGYVVRIAATVANAPIGRVSVQNNTFDISASVSALFLRGHLFKADYFVFKGNNFKGAGGVHNMGLGVSLEGVGALDQFIVAENNIDTDFWMYSGVSHNMPRLQFTDNCITRIIFEENGAGSPWGIGQWDISNNKFGKPGWSGQGIILRASSTTFWDSAASSVHVLDNQFQTTGGTAIDVNAGHTGNRFIFKRNFLNAAVITDATSTYHSTDGNYTSGNQLGKGGTFARTDGLYSTAAPTGGTWVTGNKIYNSAPADSAGSPTGWVNVVAGSPGSWRGFGATL